MTPLATGRSSLLPAAARWGCRLLAEWVRRPVAGPLKKAAPDHCTTINDTIAHANANATNTDTATRQRRHQRLHLHRQPTPLSNNLDTSR